MEPHASNADASAASAVGVGVPPLAPFAPPAADPSLPASSPEPAVALGRSRPLRTMLPRMASMPRMSSMPSRRPSLQVLLKQNSKERLDPPPASNDPQETTPEQHPPDRATQPGAPAAGKARVAAIPKLHRQLSMLATRSRALEPPVPSPEEKVKAQRYERMMDRFQLRRVPLARSARSATSNQLTAGRTSSSGGTTTNGGGASSRMTTYRMNSLENLSNLASAVTRRGSRRASGTGTNSIAASTADDKPAAEPRRPSVESRLSHYSSVPMRSRSVVRTDVGARGDDPAAHLTTWLATGVATRVRLTILLISFVAKLVYIPYGVAYLPPDHIVTIVVSAIVDIVFGGNIVATCNTETQTSRGQVLSTRRAIWRYYRQNGLVIDFLASLPFEFVLLGVGRLAVAQWVISLLKVVLQLMCAYRHVTVFQAAWAKQVIGADKSVVAWMLYSRYSHLVRIGGIVLMILLLAHYFACMWSWLHTEIDPDFFTSDDTFVVHMNSIYDALQLLQGQGVVTKTLPQALFGSFAVLLGSIALAVVFGHVAILVANFSANNTAYQRKMERVFAVMGKLQLPHPVRERVHQYYEYLHAEYESLDGEVVKFAKDLSHTLELEVVLFKYMDVLMHVPHWRNCSPDFQKQLVLTLSVRVYLPDDFVMRRGEVGTECYIINRGTCKQCEYPTGNYEPPTMAMLSEEDGAPVHQRALRPSRSSLSVTTPRKLPGKSTVRPAGQSRFSIYEAGQSEFEDSGDGPYSRVSELKRGQAIGDMALLSNYERSSDLRAVTYVEMCVIERETFQRILTRYPRDREVVLASIVHHVMVNVDAQRVPCTLMGMVRAIHPNASILEAVHLMSRAMNPPESDPTIVFGVTHQLPKSLERITEIHLRHRNHDDHDDDDDDDGDGDDSHSDASVSVAAKRSTAPPPTATPTPTAPAKTDAVEAEPPQPQQSVPTIVEMELLAMIKEIRDRLTRIENRQDELSTNNRNSASPSTTTRPIGCEGNCVCACRPHGTGPIIKPQSTRRLRRRHTSRSGEAQIPTCLLDEFQLDSGCGGTGTSSSTIMTAVPQPSPSPPHTARQRAATPLSSSRQPLTARSTDGIIGVDPTSPSPYADQLFQSKRVFKDEIAAKRRRSSLRRLRST